MVFKITIDTDMCKGCSLCVAACPKKCIAISAESNKHGYFPAEVDSKECTGCLCCAIMCPEAVIEIRSESKIVSIDAAKKAKPSFTKEKA